MKKVILNGVIIVGFFITSCATINHSKKKDNRSIIEKAGEDFCACAEKNKVEKEKCHNKWLSTYKGAKGSDEDGEKLAEKMIECDIDGAIEILRRLSE